MKIESGFELYPLSFLRHHVYLINLSVLVLEPVDDTLKQIRRIEEFRDTRIEVLFSLYPKYTLCLL